MQHLAIALCFSMLPTIAIAFDFKGIEVGAPTTPQEVTSKLGVSCGIGAANMQVCNGNPTIAGARAYMNLVIDAQGNVRRISLTFPSDSFPQVELGLLEKFGQPASTDERSLQNAMGAKYIDVAYSWKDDKGNAVFLQRYGAGLSTSSLLFASPEELSLMKAREDRNAKDL